MPFSVVYAQDPLTLEQATVEAVQNNPELNGLKASVGEAGWKRLESLAPQLPQLTFDASHYLTLKYKRVNGSPSPYPTTTLSVGTSLLLFDGLSSINAYRASDKNYKATKDDLIFARFALEQRVQIAFYQALAAHAFARVAEQNIKTLNDHLTIAKANEQTGTGTQFGVLRIKTQLDEAIAEKRLQDDNVVLARQQLAQIMGLNNDERSLTGLLPIPSTSLLAQIPSLDPLQRADIQAERHRVESARHTLSSDTGLLLPKISFFADREYYKYGDFDSAVTPTQNLSSAYSAGFSLSWSAWDGGAKLAQQRQSAYAEDRTRQVLKETELAAPRQLDLWKRRYAYNVELYHARLSSVKQSEEAVRLAILGLTAGTQTHTELLDAELQLFRSRAGVVQAQLDAAQALANSELYGGRKLK